MSRITLAACALMLVTAPAVADTDASVTLAITNDAGAVTMVRNMTQRECDAAVGLLSDRKQTGTYLVTGGALVVGNGTWGGVVSGYPSAPAPHTPDLTKVECVRSTADKK